MFDSVRYKIAQATIRSNPNLLAFFKLEFTLHCVICSSCGELMAAALHCRHMRNLCVFSDTGGLAVFVRLDGVRLAPSASGIRFIPDGIVFSTIALIQKANKCSAKRSEYSF